MARTIPAGTKVTWHYRSAIGHGRVVGIAKQGTTSATTKYRIKQTDHHPGEPPIVEHYGRVLTRVSKEPEHQHATKRNEIRYVYRGAVERGTGRGYRWHDGFSADSPSGGVQYPWMTKREAQRDAKAQGARAVFVRERQIPPTNHQHAAKKSSAQLQHEIDEVLAKPVTASKEISVLPPSVRVARAGLDSVREHGIRNLRYGLYRHAGDRAYQWGNFTGTPEHVITAVVPNDRNTASQEALVRALKWKR